MNYRFYGLSAVTSFAGIANLVGAAVLDPAARAIVVALCMAVLSPVMAEIGAHLPEGTTKE